MLKSQINKSVANIYGRPHKCLAFPITPEGIKLLEAYLSTQFKYPYGMLLELTLNRRDETKLHGARWDVDYVIRAGDLSTVKDGLFRLYGNDTHINVPRNFPRLARKYILKDIRDEGLTLHSMKSTNWNLDHISQDRVDTFIAEEKAHSTRIYGEPVGHDELHGRGWVEHVLNLDQPTGVIRKPTYAKEVPRSPTHLYDNPIGVEEEVKKLKEKYPEVSEEELRGQLGNLLHH